MPVKFLKSHPLTYEVDGQAQVAREVICPQHGKIVRYVLGSDGQKILVQTEGQEELSCSAWPQA
jgi:hypothetical protein